MIGVKFNGRLGNQLFQFVFFQYLRTNNKGYNFFFTNPHHSSLVKYFELGSFHDATLKSKPYSIITRILAKFIPFDEIYIQNIQVPKPVVVKNWTIYKGFFQTDWYLKRIVGGFNFRIRKKYIDQFNQQYGDVFSKEKTIAVHIRRTDYLTYGKRDISLPMEYFQRRLEQLGDISGYKIFFLSDDIEYVKSYFKAYSHAIFSNNNEITDFQIIMNADIAIISNSSFGWWAGYLSEKKRQVFAPKNWLGFKIGKEHPKGIMTDKFTWVD